MLELEPEVDQEEEEEEEEEVGCVRFHFPLVFIYRLKMERHLVV